jgi:hypothetical protein
LINISRQSLPELLKISAELSFELLNILNTEISVDEICKVGRFSNEAYCSSSNTKDDLNQILFAQINFCVDILFRIIHKSQVPLVTKMKLDLLKTIGLYYFSLV